MKRRLDLGEAMTPPVEQTPQVETKFKAKDNRVIQNALSHSTCPDCTHRGLAICRVNGRRTHFHCPKCDARFELDWTNVASGNLEGGVIVERFVTCRLCNGNGNRLVRLPPYLDPNKVEVRTCCDCDGTGQRKI